MTRQARIDPQLGVRIHSSRALTYTSPALATDDRPDHVRAASGLAMHGGRLVVVQDDASFLAIVGGPEVTAIKLPRGQDGRRRFEVAIGNKLDKLDLESCIAIDHELWAFGSGSLPIRKKICRVCDGIVRVVDATPFYGVLEYAIGGGVNLEGAARVGAELWLFHRGNTGPHDPGPAVFRLPLVELRAWLDAVDRLPRAPRVDGYNLGDIDGSRLGFTDAIAQGDQVLYLACAERVDNAVDDGAVAGSQIGVIAAGTGETRACTLSGPDGAPIKAEGIALDPARPGHAWIVLDPDDPARPSTLLDVELVGPWLA